MLTAGLTAASTAEPAAPPNRAPVVVKVTDGGFNWGDAVIGAAGGSALTLLLLGGTVHGARRQPNDDERNES